MQRIYIRYGVPLVLILSPVFSWALPHKSPACAKAKAACERAGYKGAKKGKGLIADCLKKLNAGQAVKGVKLKPTSPAVVSCKKAMRGHSKPSSKTKKIEKTPNKKSVSPRAATVSSHKELEIPEELEKTPEESSPAADPSVAEPIDGADDAESGTSSAGEDQGTSSEEIE